MPACVNDSRIEQIARCTDELQMCREHRNPCPDADLWTLGQMDWLTELHRLIWEWEEKSCALIVTEPAAAGTPGKPQRLGLSSMTTK